MKKINLIGSGGHCRSLIPIIRQNGIKINGIYDDSYSTENIEVILGIPLKGKVDEVLKSDSSVVLSVGNNIEREILFNKFNDLIFNNTIVADSVIIGKNVKLGIANQIFHQVFINTEVKIGSNNIINSKALIEHECMIGNHCHIAIGAILGGRVKIGNQCFIGAGAVIKDKINICDNVIIGAGGVVINDILQPGTYVGNPVRKIK